VPQKLRSGNALRKSVMKDLMLIATGRGSGSELLQCISGLNSICDRSLFFDQMRTKSARGPPGFPSPPH